MTVPASSTGSMVGHDAGGGHEPAQPGRRALQLVAPVFLGYAGTFNVSSTTTTLRLNGVVPGQVYYIQTFGDGYAWNSDGNYGLQVNFSSSAAPADPLAGDDHPRRSRTRAAAASTSLVGHGSKPIEPWLRRLEGSGPRQRQRARTAIHRHVHDRRHEPRRTPSRSCPPADTSGSTVTISLTAPAGPLKPARPSLLAAGFYPS